MDRNFLLALALSMLVFTFWASYQARNQPERLRGDAESAQVADPEAVPAPLAGSPPRTAPITLPSAPTPTARPGAAAPELARGTGPAPDALSVPSAPDWVRVYEGEHYRATLTNRGASLLNMQLIGYDEWAPGGNRPIDLLNGQEDPVLVVGTPFEELGLGDLRAVNFEVEEERADGATFRIQAGGLTLRKRFEFDLAGNGFRLSVELENDSGEALEPRFAIEWPARVREGDDYRELSFVSRPDGEIARVAVGSVGSSGFLGFGGDDGLAKGQLEGVKWFGVDTRYFVAALAPERSADARAIAVPIEDGKMASHVLYFDGISLPSGTSISQELRGYVGPKTDAELEAFGAELLSSVDRGWSWLEPLTRFFSWLLRALYGIVGNYGVAIIVITFLVRIVTTPIMQRQMKSMEKMRLVQPQLKELQEKFKDDREKQSQEMMKLYKEHGVNPLGGCLPMLLQLPVFIGLFYALQSSIELRHAPFVLWINDLSAPEALFTIPGLEIPFRVLPILMAASMALQAKLQPTSPDPSQAQMMMTIMPIMMLVLFYQFPSGLVLYYMLSNFLGIAHQRWVGRNMQPATT